MEGGHWEDCLGFESSVSSRFRPLLGPHSEIISCSVAYSTEDYEIYRTDGKTGELGKTAQEALDAQEAFKWVSTPPAKVAMHDFAWWENPERWAPWDEP